MQLVGCPGLLHGSWGCRPTRGHAHRGRGHETSQSTGEDLEEERSELWTGPGNLILSTPPSPPMGKHGGTTDSSPAATSYGQNRAPGAPSTLPGSGDTRSLTACSQQGVPGFGLASVPPTLKEMSPAHSLSCNKPQQNYHLPGILSPRLCGRTRSDSPPIAGLLGEESEASGDPWEQQPGHCRARSGAATAAGTRCGPGRWGEGQRGQRRSG